MASFSTVKPVFLKQRDIPNAFDDRPTVLEICVAAERAAGQGNILGAQQIGGLWRIYPASEGGRTDILIQGVRLRNTALQVASTNPFILRNDTGEEKPATKVWVDNLPLSVAESEIEHALVKAGCELRSGIKLERARDQDNKLTRFLTGRRFVFVSVPASPLGQFLPVNIFKAKIYHKEQKLVGKKVVCSRCLEPNHHVSQCSKQVVCRQCKQPGHKRGDSACQMVTEVAGQKQGGGVGVQPDIQLVTVPDACKQTGGGGEKAGGDGEKTGGGGEKAGGGGEKAGGGGEKAGSGGSRSRPLTRQSTLLSYDQSSRRRSETPKRQRSKERRSPTERTEKQRKNDCQRCTL